MNIREFISEYFKMSRYVALGTMDGILAVMGVTLTASGVAGVSGLEISNFAVGLTGLSGGIALALSNAFGSFIGERAEEVRSIRELEQKMMLEEGKLDDTHIHQQAKKRIYMSMFTHGFSSFIGSFVPVVPFILISDRINATICTVILCFVALVILGVYLGKVSRESLLKTSVEIMLIGVLISVVSYLIGGGHG
ncbi:TIGR00267 family protein [Methanobacterium sp. MZ-A1]|jgi:predicted membrane protein (TIGR00267 family)|uniref:TIGR00267 family protein n=1 Tax=Methanobacterium subterraneum TaxID=59277 RepID=A0A2H4VQ67_9EURY|nr:MULTISPECIES: TIGR00267 family protein [Methanobacterium]AUB57089.1 TIGR00267 family protein [Methanobacterium sp. MZ-A1]AUB60231.1 TIGR00267 family protein [Methanobacterium subterraneum]MBW4257969.1 TIGR00267 family protein [Methanobacterium sp. YSL]